MSVTWKISTLDRDVATGYVTTAHWTASAVDGEHSASVYATVSWAEGTPAIAYASLTEATVLNWVWESVDKTATESALAAQIALLKNPVKANGTPWGQA
tara:strand:+ start:1567 stop:1863 length:297 start_codon:yes stop_codon:yes gene_type:complete